MRRLPSKRMGRRILVLRVAREKLLESAEEGEAGGT